MSTSTTTSGIIPVPTTSTAFVPLTQQGSGQGVPGPTTTTSALAGQSTSTHGKRHPARAVFSTKVLMTCVSRFLMPTFSSFISGIPVAFPHTLPLVNRTCCAAFKETLKTHAHVVGFLNFVRLDSGKWFINRPNVHSHRKVHFTYKMMINLANYIRNHGNTPWTTPADVLDPAVNPMGEPSGFSQLTNRVKTPAELIAWLYTNGAKHALDRVSYYMWVNLCEKSGEPLTGAKNLTAGEKALRDGSSMGEMHARAILQSVIADFPNMANIAYHVDCSFSIDASRTRGIPKPSLSPCASPGTPSSSGSFSRTRSVPNFPLSPSAFPGSPASSGSFSGTGGLPNFPLSPSTSSGSPTSGSSPGTGHSETPLDLPGIQEDSDEG